MAAHKKQSVFQIEQQDNVVTALMDLEPGEAIINGDRSQETAMVLEQVTAGQKIALRDISEGKCILKYGVVIGQATKNIVKGQWVHLHNMKSQYDARSSSLDVVTGAPTDTHYE